MGQSTPAPSIPALVLHHLQLRAQWADLPIGASGPVGREARRALSEIISTPAASPACVLAKLDLLAAAGRRRRQPPGDGPA